MQKLTPKLTLINAKINPKLTQKLVPKLTAKLTLKLIQYYSRRPCNTFRYPIFYAFSQITAHSFNFPLLVMHLIIIP